MADKPTYNIKLDKSRDHAVVFPPENGAHFYQDGLYFSHDSSLVVDMIDENGAKILKRKEAKAAAQKAAAEVYRNMLKEGGVADEEIEAELGKAKDAGTVTADPEAIDLLAWAKGQKNYPFFQVRKAFQTQHAKVINDKADGLEWLVLNDKIEADEIPGYDAIMATE